MSTEQPNGDARLTNTEILRDLRHDSAEHGKGLAVLQTQIGTVQGLIERFTGQYEILNQRIGATESADVAIRVRLAALESHPPMTHEERATLKHQANDHEHRIATTEAQIHEAQVRDLSAEQKDDVRRALIDRQRRGRWRDELSGGAVLQILTPIGLILALAVAHFAGW